MHYKKPAFVRWTTENPIRSS